MKTIDMLCKKYEKLLGPGYVVKNHGETWIEDWPDEAWKETYTTRADEWKRWWSGFGPMPTPDASLMIRTRRAKYTIIVEIPEADQFGDDETYHLYYYDTCKQFQNKITYVASLKK